MSAETATGHWFKVAVTCDSEAVEMVAALFADHGVNEGVVIEEPFAEVPGGDALVPDPSRPVTVSTYLDAKSDDVEDRIDNIRLALARLAEAYCISHPVIRNVVVHKRQEDDWADAWITRSSILRVGHRVVVKAPWHDYDPAPGEIILQLVAGMAFGAGSHPTTHLAMEALEDELAPGARVLDVGTGTGILAVAAARLGAGVVHGVDIDPVAIRVARENAERNGVDGVVRIELGTVGPGQPFQGGYDLVVANILADVLVELAAGLTAAVRAAGLLLLGGIIDFKEADVREAFEALGCRLVRRDECEGWVAMVLRAPEPEAEHRFASRLAAGERLAGALMGYQNDEPLVLGIPRGGVVVAAAVARVLGADLDVVISRKLEVPFEPDLAMGAVTADGALYVNERSLAAHNVTADQLAEVIARETAEAHSRHERFRGDRPPPRIANRTVIVVDDGLATGATMRATLRALRTREPGRLVVAVPVGDRDACEDLQAEADDVVCLTALGSTGAVGSHYDDFRSPSDETVQSLLRDFGSGRGATT
jgi:ribosomal protein L11 methyltransferase